MNPRREIRKEAFQAQIPKPQCQRRLKAEMGKGITGDKDDQIHLFRYGRNAH